MPTAITTRLSMNELTGCILDMAQTGVYRESLFEAFKPVATKKQIKAAIALAKQFGLQTDPTLRDTELGTYYQADIQKVTAFQTAIQNSVQLSAGDDMAEKMLAATRIVKLMLGDHSLGCLCVATVADPLSAHDRRPRPLRGAGSYNGARGRPSIRSG